MQISAQIVGKKPALPLARRFSKKATIQSLQEGGPCWVLVLQLISLGWPSKQMASWTLHNDQDKEPRLVPILQYPKKKESKREGQAKWTEHLRLLLES